ncbi:MAG: phosphate signaling complex protein PhoU [Syntrophobacteraceae bacterium]
MASESSPLVDHTVRSFSQELRQLNAVIQEMGNLAATQLEAAMKALSSRDSKGAAAVVLNDEIVNRLEHDVDTITLKLLALRQPVAFDLRAILVALRISIDLERVADYAANVAKRVRDLNQTPLKEVVDALLSMGDIARAMITGVVTAYRKQDVDLALDVWRQDDRIDEIYNRLLCLLRSTMMEDPHLVPVCTSLLLVSKSLERIGDHVTNVAEHIFFLVRGVCWHEARPRDPAHCPESGSV